MYCVGKNSVRVRQNGSTVGCLKKMLVEACAKALESKQFGFGGRLERDEIGVAFLSDNGQKMYVDGGELARLETLFSSSSSEQQQSGLVETVCRAYTTAGGMPSLYQDAKSGLFPQLWSTAKIRAKQSSLSGVATLPFCGLHGEEDGDYDVVVVVVYDSNPSPLSFSHETPVLSRDLVRWQSESWTQVLRDAMENLRTLTKKREENKEVQRFVVHESGCGVSGWSDRYDAARCALLPAVVSRAAKSPGASVCIFASRRCAFTTSARNPMGLCYAGDCALTKISENEVISRTPYRLAKVKYASGQNKKHPLIQKAGEGVTWKWQRYVPSISSGEFCVPKNEEQINGILDAVEAGRPTPVFGDVMDARRAQELQERCEKLKTLGNAKFAAGDYRAAAAAYAQGAKLLDDEGSQESQHIFSFFTDNRAIKTVAATRANLAAALLQDSPDKSRAAEALRHAMRSVELDPEYAKGHARCAAAFKILGENDAAAESEAIAANLAAAVKADKIAAAKAANDAREALIEARRLRNEAKEKAAAEARNKKREKSLRKEQQKTALPQPPPSLPSTMISIDASLDPLGLGPTDSFAIPQTPLFQGGTHRPRSIY